MKFLRVSLLLCLLGPMASAQVSVVPTDVQMPGTQALEAAQLENSGNCLSCHYGYDFDKEPGHLWTGSMMSHAGRDPLYWAAVAVSEQTFPGSADLCIRCHSPRGWLDGRSTPTDGSALTPDDSEGVTCALCHLMVDPSELEYDGLQTAPFIANDGTPVPEGWHGAGEYVITSGTDRLGPYPPGQALHGAAQSKYHRDPAICGTCHDVSNPVTGDLAPSHGAMMALPPGSFSGVPGTPVAGKAAFNNPPHAFGVVERTYSEFVASSFDTMRVKDFPTFSPELKRGVIKDVYDSATLGVPSGDFEDGSARFYTCQSCHMQPAVGRAAKQEWLPTHQDLGTHDLTGGSTWMPDAIRYLDAQGKLVQGGGLVVEHHNAMDDGIVRARAMLQSAAAIDIAGETVRVTNLTGHKLISGYPEGRRMWLSVRWLGPGGELIQETGKYGDLEVVHKGQAYTVKTLLDDHNPELRRYDVHMGLRQDWAAKLLTMGTSASLPLAYDRLDGTVLYTVGDLAAMPVGAALSSFHFVLNDQVISDTRIPPYGMDYAESMTRNILPVPSNQYGNPGIGSAYLNYDEFGLTPPVGAASGEIKLWYQSTSWEYIQFLDLASTGAVPFLANAAGDMFDAWLNTGMAPPELITTAIWTESGGDCDHDGLLDSLEIAGGTETDCDGNGVLDSCQMAVNNAADLDFDGGLDTCQTLSADVASISLGYGGAQTLSLHAGASQAGHLYIVAGSVSGTSPGLNLGPVTVPLVYDGYFDFTLSHMNTPLLQGSFGYLDAAGKATMTIAIPPAALSNLAGLVANHAFVSIDPTTLVPTLASNPIALALAP
ncbi:MAG: hypothetical protein ACJAZ8_001263 [Planctomycetota bacterium]|jgi:hypothetical protein